MIRRIRPWRGLGRPPGHRALVLLGAAIAISAVRPAAGEPAPPAPPAGRQVAHSLRIVHPGDATATPAPHDLVQTLDENGEPVAYSLWVDSVICRETVCDVVKVRLHWDALGRYQRYEVAPGSRLTKLDHVPFTPADLARLHQILADPESPLREVDKESMTGAPPPAGVDAVSSPTILTLKTAVVVGAGYTCYDLWHWANRLLTGHIRGFTGSACSNGTLRAYLAGDDASAARLALEHLARRGPLEPATLDAITAACRNGSEALVRPALACLEGAVPDERLRDEAILRIFADAGSKKRVRILEFLLKTPRKPGPGFCERLCDHLPALGSYYEIHLFLNLMNLRNPGSSKVNRQAADLLDHDHFFVSRRAYQHLSRQELPAELRKRVDAYADKHRDRL